MTQIQHLSIGGTFSKPHKPTLKPSFVKEPPSLTNKKDTTLQRTNMTEKKHELLKHPPAQRKAQLKAQPGE